MAGYSRSLSKTRLFFSHRKELFSTAALLQNNKQKQQLLEDNNQQNNKMNLKEDKMGLDLVKKVYELVMKEKLLSGHYGPNHLLL